VRYQTATLALYFLVVSCCYFPLPAAFGAESKQLLVQVRSTKLRSTPSHFSTPISTLSFGQSVAVLSEGDGWVKVRVGKAEGFLHKTAIAPRAVVLGAAGEQRGARSAASTDVALAGKGFGKELERSLDGESGYDFQALSKMERIVIGDSDLATFRKGGQLS